MRYYNPHTRAEERILIPDPTRGLQYRFYLLQPNGDPSVLVLLFELKLSPQCFVWLVETADIASLKQCNAVHPMRHWEYYSELSSCNIIKPEWRKNCIESYRSLLGVLKLRERRRIIMEGFPYPTRWVSSPNFQWLFISLAWQLNEMWRALIITKSTKSENIWFWNTIAPKPYGFGHFL